MALSFFSFGFGGTPRCSICSEMAISPSSHKHNPTPSDPKGFLCFHIAALLILCLCHFLQLRVDRTRPEKTVK